MPGSGTPPSPVAAAVSSDGVILVLEGSDGNNRIQAFDTGGNAVPYFTRQPRPYFLQLPAGSNTLYLACTSGAIGKAGAESVYVLALPDGRAFATKTDDGAARARPVVMAALLDQLGVTGEPGVDGDAVRRTGESPLLGGGRPVGEIRATIAV